MAMVLNIQDSFAMIPNGGWVPLGFVLCLSYKQIWHWNDSLLILRSKYLFILDYHVVYIHVVFTLVVFTLMSGFPWVIQARWFYVILICMYIVNKGIHQKLYVPWFSFHCLGWLCCAFCGVVQTTLAFIWAWNAVHYQKWIVALRNGPPVVLSASGSIPACWPQTFW